eukprot:TRINITY_DN64719_c0_g1_i1.p1 TRINITY_DN64719_c0_g1~~TRINITY_DN64719_c0_g1_i1.p1  ORF type:complete len:304 (-),score=36.35 TRINITY_DN64719_c0_g1_i1:100-1011(-)
MTKGDAERALSACVCEESAGCTCDFTARGSLDATFASWGYDTCLKDGECERCLPEQASLASCHDTGWRQRVVCAQCAIESDKGSPIICTSKIKPLWVANISSVPPKGMAITPLFKHRLNYSDDNYSPGMVFKSCVEGEADDAILVGEAADQYNRVTLRPRRPAADESFQVLAFLTLNVIVLLLAFFSLRRLQRAQLEKTMEALNSRVDADHQSVNSNGGGQHVAVTASSCGAAAPNRRTSSAIIGGSASSSTLPGSGRRSEVKQPESIGRSIGPIATAVARTGNAIEIAVLGESNSGSAQKLK